MATRFDFDSVFDSITWTVKYPNAEGYQEKFYALVKHEIEASNFPNISIIVDEYITGGLFLNKEATKMVKLKAIKTSFKQFEVYYRAQVFGNIVIYTRLSCMERSFFGTINGKTGNELKAELRAKCKNMAQWEEIIGIENMSNLIFEAAMLQMDPNYKERKILSRN